MCTINSIAGAVNAPNNSRDAACHVSENEGRDAACHVSTTSTATRVCIPLLWLLFSVFGSIISGCNGKPAEPDQPDELTGLTVSPTSISMACGEGQQFTATAIPEDARNVAFSWSSGNDDIATVSPTGYVTARGAGSTMITVTANNQSYDVPVTVTVDQINTWLMSSMVSLSSYESLEPSNTIAIHMARNEAEHIQLVLQTAEEGVVMVERNTPNQGISLEVKEIRAFENVEDVLVPIPEGTVTTTQEVKLWLTFETTSTTPAGKFNEVIRFKGSSSGDCSTVIEIEVNVYDVTLPITPTVTSLFGIDPYAIASGVTGENLITKYREFSDALLKRRITPYFCKWIGDMKVECYTSPYPSKDPRTLAYLGDARMKDVVLPYYELSASDVSILTNSVKTLHPDKGRIFYLWDEPSLLSEYEQIKSMADAIHEVDPQARVITTFYHGPDDPNYGNFAATLTVWDILTGNHILCVAAGALNENYSAQSLAKCGPGQEWWMYVCMSQRPGLSYNSTRIENRAVMWRIYKEQAGGFLYWVVNAFLSLSPLQTRPESPPGDGLLLYPGTSFGYNDGPAVSMRLERWRDGAEDYELMKLLEEKQSRSAVLTLLESVYSSPGSVYLTNHSLVEEFHRKLLEELVK